MSKQRVRVAHVVLQLDVGGMEKVLAEFARNADRRRFDLRFVSLTTSGPVAREIEACGYPVTALGVKPGLKAGLVFRLACLFRQWRADVVHTHNNAPLIYGAPAARLAGAAALIHTRHGQNFRAGWRQKLAFRLASLLVNRVVCVSEDSRKMSVGEGVAPGRLQRIWNGIDLSRFAYLGPRADGPAVMVARLSPEKGTEHLVRAVALVVRQFPGFRLDIAGGGRCLPDLRALVARSGLTEHVRFLGEVADVPSVLARASLFVLPSLSEGLSLTLLEAMARGLPVVTTAVGGSPELVADGQTGFLVPPAAPEALAEKLLLLLRDPDRARVLGLAGRRRVEEHFSTQAMLNQYEQLYTRALHRATPLPVISLRCPVTTRG
jgi:glycosyltransferase involved in cell wall biosynthesis